MGKVREIDKHYFSSPEERIDPALNAVIGNAAERLDLSTVVNALQAISSEIVLGKLIETLMRIAVEHAGAKRGLFLLLQSGEPRLEAEARPAGSRAIVGFSGPSKE